MNEIYIYWNSKGKYQQFVDELNLLIPDEGPVNQPRKNRALEKFRRSSNCYYDLYNNGLGNRFGEMRTVMGIAPNNYRLSTVTSRRHCNEFTPLLFEHVEARMNEIVVSAAIEQCVFS